MPQDGSNNYQYPPGTPGIPDTTIESEAYNTFLDDLVINDLNWPRPVHRGGTGASTADAALANLHAEKAEQVVTAYLSQLWLPGSFRSAIGATDAPVAGHAFSGICYINEPSALPPTNANVTIEARDQSDTRVPGLLYIRQKIAGVWSAWVSDDTSVLLDTLAFNGMQVNGSMEVQQDVPASNFSNSQLYIVDCWLGTSVGPQVLQASLQTNPLFVPPGFIASLQMYVLTANPSPSAGHYCIFETPIEGQRVARLQWGTAGARQLTIGFWIYASRAGLYSGAVRNADNSHSYVFSFTVTAVSTFQWVTVTIPGDTSGTWNKGNGIGMLVSITMMCGTTYQTSPGAWVAGNFIGANGTTNCTVVNSDIMVISGFVAFPGAQTLTADISPKLMRTHDQELQTCQRYYEKTDTNAALASIYAENYATLAGVGCPLMWWFATTKRAPPTLSAYGSWVVTNGVTASPAMTSGGGSHARASIAATTTGRILWYNDVNSGFIADARL